MLVSQAKYESRRAQYELEVRRLDRMRENLKKYSIFAPHDGVVVAAGPMALQQGSQVRQRQVVLIVAPVNNGN